jgi:hypothetical protein
MDKNPRLIASINDLSDRAREIAKSIQVPLERILPLYRELETEANEGDMETDLSGNKDEVITKLLCGAIVCYELSCGKTVRFADGGKGAVVSPIACVSDYAFLGQFYEDFAKKIRNRSASFW